MGTAPQVEIYSVKALDRTGSGYLSDIIEGLQWAVTNKMQVISMSLGTNSDNQSFHDAIIAVYNAGIIQVAAAGNDGPTDNSVDFPAKYPETIAVSAIDNLGQIPSWSSRGPEVDLAAPGVNINSTWNNDLYKVISGTSMATPHVTGTVALTIAAKGQMAPM
ncbi:MAG: S8 family serine peptidase [Carboxydocellales bacterium]